MTMKRLRGELRIRTQSILSATGRRQAETGRESPQAADICTIAAPCRHHRRALARGTRYPEPPGAARLCRAIRLSAASRLNRLTVPALEPAGHPLERILAERRLVLHAEAVGPLPVEVAL